MNITEFEKIIITDIIEQYPEYKSKLRAQFEYAVVQKREFSKYGFSTDYVVEPSLETLGDDVNLQLGKRQWNINNLQNGSDYILWIKNGLICSLEGFSYEEPWPDEILWCKRIENLR